MLMSVATAVNIYLVLMTCHVAFQALIKLNLLNNFKMNLRSKYQSNRHLAVRKLSHRDKLVQGYAAGI